MNEKISYSEAIEELEEIVRDMEESEIDIDELASKVKRASMLISICKKKLSGTEDEVKQILDSLKQDSDD